MQTLNEIFVKISALLNYIKVNGLQKETFELNLTENLHVI